MSAALHLALLGWLMMPHAPSALAPNAAENVVEVEFEAAAPPQPAPEPPTPPVAAAPDSTMPEPPPVLSAPDPLPPDPPPEPAVPEAVVETPPEPPQAEPEPPVSSIPAPLPPSLPALVQPAPILPTPVTPPVRPLPRPKPVTPRLFPTARNPGAQAVPNAPEVRPAPPPVAAVPAAPAPAPAAATNDPGWRAALGSWLAARKRYPEQARQHGDEGTVGVRFTVDAAGRVLDVAITRSSGSPLLDNAAREMLAGQRVPPFPSGMTVAQMTVPVNIRFQLEQ